MCKRWSLSHIISAKQWLLEAKAALSMLPRTPVFSLSPIWQLTQRPKLSSSTSARRFTTNSPERRSRNGDLPGPDGDQLLRGHIHADVSKEHGQFRNGCEKNTEGV